MWKADAKQGLFNMTSSSHLFKEKDHFERLGFTIGEQQIFETDKGAYVPLYEGKFLSHFDHRFSSYHNLGKEKGRGGRGLPPVKLEEYQDFEFEVLPRYWVDKSDVKEALRQLSWTRQWLLSWRDIANAKVERTTTFSIIPWSGVGDTASLLFPDQEVNMISCLVANFNSLIFDYCSRQIVGGTHMTFGYLKQLPILPPSAYTEADLAFIVPRVLELSYTSHSMAPFARDLGYDGEPFAWDEDRRAQLRAELDGWYAVAYGLTRDELRYVLDPKDVMGAAYPSETFRVLQKNEIAKHGEYRTQRLVLAAYDALSGAAPETDTLADNQWQGTISEEADVRLLLAAILKRMRQPRSSREVRAAFLYAAQPHLLMPHVNTTARAEWRRLVGDAASLPVSQSVPTLSSTQLAHFGTAQAILAARNAWRYDAGADLVDRGAAIYDMVLPPWVEGRADFVWYALRSIDLSSPAVTTALSQGEKSFVAQAAAA